MSTITNIAKSFFHACETGGGWEACKAYCAPNAIFSAQADALAKVETLQEYTDWMKGLLAFVPNGRYEIKSFATDDERQNVAVYGIFMGRIRVTVVRVRLPARAHQLTTCMSSNSMEKQSSD